LAYLTRHVSETFNESLFILLSVVGTGFVAIGVLPVLSTSMGGVGDGDGGDGNHLWIRVLGVWLVCTGNLVMLVGSKMLGVYLEYKYTQTRRKKFMESWGVRKVGKNATGLKETKNLASRNTDKVVLDGREKTEKDGKKSWFGMFQVKKSAKMSETDDFLNEELEFHSSHQTNDNVTSSRIVSIDPETGGGGGEADTELPQTNHHLKPKSNRRTGGGSGGSVSNWSLRNLSATVGKFLAGGSSMTLRREPSPSKSLAVPLEKATNEYIDTADNHDNNYAKQDIVSKGCHQSLHGDDDIDLNWEKDAEDPDNENSLWDLDQRQNWNVRTARSKHWIVNLVCQ
jgi:hypothetical protein